MNIAFLIGTLERAGAQRLILNIIKNLDKKHFKPFLIYWRKSDFFKEFKKIKDLNIIELNNKPENNSFCKILNFFISIKQIIELRKIIKNHNIQIIHSNLITSDIYNFILKIQYRNLKIISTRHNVAEIRKTLFFRFFNKIINSFFDKIVLCSKDVQLLFNKYEFSNNSVVIYNGVDVNEIQEAPIKNYPFIKKESFNIISIGRLEMVKGYPNLIYIFKKFNEDHPNSNLFICGMGKDYFFLKKLVKQIKIQDKITFLGNRDDVYSLLKSCNIFMLLSKREGLPLSLLEAMCCKLPVIGSNVSGIRQVIKNRVNGYLVNRFNHDNIINIMRKLKDNKSLRKKIGNEAYKEIIRTYTIRKTYLKYQAIYLSFF